MRDAKRLVVKIGSALLVDRKTGLKQAWLSALALDVAEAKTRGTDVVLVSSGSIALGRKVLGLPDGVLTLEQSQAAAAVGQIRLARAYEEVLAPHGIITAQVLVTLEDTTDRRRYLNRARRWRPYWVSAWCRSSTRMTQWRLTRSVSVITTGWPRKSR